MSAYSALVSLRHIIEQVQYHPRPPISLDKSQVESLIEKVTSLQAFLEGYPIVNGGYSDEDAEVLEGRIADAAHEAEDVIESHIVAQIQSHGEGTNFIDLLYPSLGKVIQDLDVITKKITTTQDDGDRLLIMPDSGSVVRSPSSNVVMVGVDDAIVDVMNKLAGQGLDRRIVPIVGMGGMGKTTLATNIYVNPLIVERFNVRAWATISQEYNTKDILLEILVCLVHNRMSKEFLIGKSCDELGMALHKILSGRRYLIVMDDVWSIEAWDGVKLFFPENNNGSRIMVTTRLSNMALELSGSFDNFAMSFLDQDQSWYLLCKTVFGEESCPLELEEIGKNIAKKCKGLPLSIVVVGGFLAKSQPTRQQWEYIEENLNSAVNLGSNENCFKILHMSYKQLPVHLKPCFLYMGVFPEDAKIRVSTLVKLWVAEGFLKPIHGKSLEMIAEEYLADLISRNLVLVDQFGSAGNIKLCTIHDLLRDLCLRVAHKERFLNVINLDNISTDTSNHRRICFPQSTPQYDFRPYYSGPRHPDRRARALLPKSHTRSLICDSPLLLSSVHSRLLRVFKAADPSRSLLLDSLGDIFLKLANSRYLGVKIYWHEIPSNNLSSLHLLWNLQTLIVEGPIVIAPSEIWNMSQLRHIKFRRLQLPDPPSGDDEIVLGNLQTLSTVQNFKCSEEVVRRIPNIKKLRVYVNCDGNEDLRVDNLGLVHKLESLCFIFHDSREEQRRAELLLRGLTFPRRLKKLTLTGSRLRWNSTIMKKIGSLPHLEVLILRSWSFVGPEWITVEGQFESLKFLLIEQSSDLEYWTTDRAHFPNLEHVVLRYLDKLKEIPMEIGDIDTLRSIELEYCSNSAVVSARKILEEQKENGNEVLQLRVQVQPWEETKRP